MLFLIVVLLIGLGVFGYFAPSSLPGRFVHTVLSVVGLGAKSFKERNALANYNAALERRSASLGDGISGAGNYEALIASKNRIREQIEREIRECEARLDVLDEDGVPDTDARKTRLGESLIQLQERLATVKADLERYSATKATFVATLQAEGREIADGRRKAQELAADLQASEVERELAGHAAAFDPGRGHDTLAEAESIVRERIDRNRGMVAATKEVLGQDAADGAIDGRVKEKKVADFLEARRAAKGGV